jgi:putative membrane protein
MLLADPARRGPKKHGVQSIERAADARRGSRHEPEEGIMKRISSTQRPPKRLAFILAAAAAVGCASTGTTSGSTAGGATDLAAARTNADSGRVIPAGETGAVTQQGIQGAGQTAPGTPSSGSFGGTIAPDTGGTAAGRRNSGGGAAEASASMMLGSAASDANIVALLHESNVGEIQAGTLAQQRATNGSARSFAQQMVTDHTALDARGRALASQAGITPALPDSTLPRQNMADMASLQSQSGAAFDRAYLAQQVTAHQRTLALVDASIPMAKNAALRTMLQSEVRPRVADHLRMAQQLQGQVGTAP